MRRKGDRANEFRGKEKKTGQMNEVAGEGKEDGTGPVNQPGRARQRNYRKREKADD